MHGMTLQLSAEQLSRLEGVSSVAMGVLHESITGSMARFTGAEILDLPNIPVA
ncbi:hypothetical protein ACYZTR_13330 [Pseudomonas sp. Hz4]